MKIIVRTKTFPVFQMFFKSFILFYPDRIKDLTAQVMVEGNNYKLYETLQKVYSFNIDFVNNLVLPDQQYIHNNGWAHMIHHSLKNDDVISLDDDIIFIASGLFDKIEFIYNMYDVNLLSFRYSSSNIDNIINSAFICKKNTTIDETEFTNIQDIKEYDGVDTALILNKHKKEHIFLDELIKTKYSKNSYNSFLTEYFIHLGGVSVDYNNILVDFIPKQ